MLTVLMIMMVLMMGWTVRLEDSMFQMPRLFPFTHDEPPDVYKRFECTVPLDFTTEPVTTE